MSDDKEKSAIDAIYDILDLVSGLEKRLDVIDSNVKLLNNKVSKLQKLSLDAKGGPTESGRPSARTPQGKPATPEDIDVKDVSRLIIGKVKTYGYIVNKDKVPIENVLVNVYDGNEVVRSIKTNSEGFWDARLPSGKYGIEYVHKKFKPINRTINIPEDVKEFEVR